MSDTLQLNTCPVCNSGNLQKVLQTTDWLVSKEPFDIVECKKCTFRFTQNAPTEENVGPYYDTEEYVEHSDTSKGLVFSLYHVARKWMLNRKLHLIKKASSGKMLLDVGSASGYFLNHMKNAGYHVEGVEISEKARNLCKSKFNIETYDPRLLIDHGLSHKYDIISLWHVFEHVYTYDEYFSAFNSLLKPGGKLFIAMPNYTSLDAKYYGKYWNAYDVPRHIWHFNVKSFNSFANSRGFSIVQKKRLPLDPFYNAMVSAEFKPKYTFVGWALCVGLMSYLNSLLNIDRSSSIVYVLEKNN